ncbi:MAG TPA: FAD-dependent oxidoreductase, partial [Chitinophagaceae bacterium]|nr:FAD-dependent oxidoreductase [Chitinophagaceae bacterium]
MFAVYILLCSDNSYYTGLTNDLEKRIWQHETGFFPECYTYKRRPVELVWHTVVHTSEEANDLERQIKGWTRKKKEALVKGDIEELKKISNHKKESAMALRQAQGQIEFLIIGQGICGTWLSYFFQKENRSFLVIDDNQPNSSSRIAAGIINPVTGRSIVKTWMIDELIHFIETAYSEIGKELDIIALSPKTIIDFFPTPQMREAFLQRQKDEPFLQTATNEDAFKNNFNYEFGFGKIDPSFIVHLETLLPAWRNHLIKSTQIAEESFDLSQLKISANKIQYKEFIAEKIIFCDGIGSLENPLFARLPFAFNKGEMLLIETDGISPEHIYKKGLILAPLQSKNIFWAGTNYVWDYNDVSPTKEFREKTEQQLKEWLKVPFKVLDHMVSVRPANVERRPFAGMHPVYKNVGILNGMGSKGCSLAPFFAKQLADHLIHGKKILLEADILR